jgi:hypothetical protein
MPIKEVVTSFRETMPIDEKNAQQWWISGGGISLAPETILLELKLSGAADFLRSLLARKIAGALATKRNLALSDDELDDAVASFYSDRALFEAAQIAPWLQMMHLDEASVREYVRETAMAEGARVILVTDEAVRDRFASERYDYMTAATEVFEFATAGAAKEFILAVREKEAIAPNGEPRDLTRRDAPEEIAAALFSCEPGDLVGPVETDAGSHEVFVLRGRADAELDDDLHSQIRDEMFRQLIDVELTRNPLKFLK